MQRYELFAQAVALALGAPDVEAWPWDGCDEDWTEPVYVDAPSLGSFCVLDLDADAWSQQVSYAVEAIRHNAERRDHPSIRHNSTTTVAFTRDELATLIDALDTHEYWQIADRGGRLPVRNGAVWLPGDYDGPDKVDPFWPEASEQHDELTQLAIDEARSLRNLAERLRLSLHELPARRTSVPRISR